jgi:hypothetical protein
MNLLHQPFSQRPFRLVPNHWGMGLALERAFYGYESDQSLYNKGTDMEGREL